MKRKPARKNDEYSYSHHWPQYHVWPQDPDVHQQWYPNWNPDLDRENLYIPKRFSRYEKCVCTPGRYASRRMPVKILRAYRNHGDGMIDYAAEEVDIYMCENCYALEKEQEREAMGATGEENRTSERSDSRPTTGQRVWS